MSGAQGATHAAHLRKHLGCADLLGTQVCFLSHANHQFLSTDSVQITVFHTKTNFYGEITGKNAELLCL